MPKPKRSSIKKPQDGDELANLVVGLATGATEQPKTQEGKDPAAVALGRKGGLKGGKARAKALSPSRRAEIARAGASARWKKPR